MLLPVTQKQQSVRVELILTSLSSDRKVIYKLYSIILLIYNGFHKTVILLKGTIVTNDVKMNVVE